MIKHCPKCGRVRQYNDVCIFCRIPLMGVDEFESAVIEHLETILKDNGFGCTISNPYAGIHIAPVNKSNVDPGHCVEIHVLADAAYVARVYITNGHIKIVPSIFNKSSIETKVQLADPDCFQQFQTMVSKLL